MKPMISLLLLSLTFGGSTAFAQETPPTTHKPADPQKMAADEFATLDKTRTAS